MTSSRSRWKDGSVGPGQRHSIEYPAQRHRNRSRWKPEWKTTDARARPLALPHTIGVSSGNKNRISATTPTAGTTERAASPVSGQRVRNLRAHAQASSRSFLPLHRDFRLPLRLTVRRRLREGVGAVQHSESSGEEDRGDLSITTPTAQAGSPKLLRLSLTAGSVVRV